MKRTKYIIVAFFAFSGCGGWGGYIHDSEKFKFQATFPAGWEVWDKSDDRRDFLEASFNGNPDTRLELVALPVSPDLETKELYPFFSDGEGDAAELQDFEVEERGTAYASNGEGRFITVKWTGEKHNMRGYRALFLGNRYRLNVRASMPEDLFMANEMEFTKMMRMIRL